jgi:hypothetical protein
VPTISSDGFCFALDSWGRPDLNLGPSTSPDKFDPLARYAAEPREHFIAEGEYLAGQVIHFATEKFQQLAECDHNVLSRWAVHRGFRRHQHNQRLKHRL